LTVKSQDAVKEERTQKACWLTSTTSITKELRPMCMVFSSASVVKHGVRQQQALVDTPTCLLSAFQHHQTNHIIKLSTNSLPPAEIQTLWTSVPTQINI
jgi:hypothetical protein